MILVTGPGTPSPRVFPPSSVTGVTSAEVLLIKASCINLILFSCMASSLILIPASCAILKIFFRVIPESI